VFVVNKVKTEVICAEIPAPAIPGWQHLISQLSSYWLTGNSKYSFRMNALKIYFKSIMYLSQK